jgi:phosphoglycolate phosphatase
VSDFLLFLEEVMLKAVLVDFDDTLCPTEAAGFAFENEVLRIMRRPPQTRSVHRETWGQSLFEAIKVRSPGVDAEEFGILVRELLPRWVADGKFDCIPDANLEVLDELKRAGKSIYIVTSRVRDEVSHLLEPTHSLATRIRAFYYHEVLEHHKPDPRTFDTVLRAHNLRRSDCVYVGDTLGDAAAAKQAGLYFVANLESGIRTIDEFTTSGVDRFIYHFTELPAALAELSSMLTA